jgi:imidazolonepropionase-like amidohydrolase
LREFDEVKEQMLKVFEKAGDKGVRISIPSDYVVARRPSNSIKV